MVSLIEAGIIKKNKGSPQEEDSSGRIPSITSKDLC